jgi:hypothetical protein
MGRWRFTSNARGGWRAVALLQRFGAILLQTLAGYCRFRESAAGEPAKMHLILLAVGVLMVIIGVVLIRYGIPLDEYGNSPLLMSGMVALTGGLILIALSAAVRGINRIAERLDIQPLPTPPIQEIEVGTPRRLPPTPLVPPKPAAEGDTPAPEAPAGTAAAPVPVVEPEAPPTGPQIPPKTSLLGGLFGRSKQRAPEPPRKEEPKTEPPAPPPPPSVDLGPLTEVIAPEAVLPPPPSAPPANGSETSRPLPKSVEPSGAAVYKSGVIDGMAYTLYVDGSIEAELEHGRVRFAAVEDLQKYLLNR